ncbi:hypothetical protein FM036_44705, partial [Nostoc sp. HG1]|nr:hypothetical protein [Nostoc sp. HG1]
MVSIICWLTLLKQENLVVTVYMQRYLRGNLFRTYIAFPSHMVYIIAPLIACGEGVGVGFLYLTQLRTAISCLLDYLLNLKNPKEPKL